MKGFIHLKLTRIQLLCMPLALLYGCASSPTVIPMAMAGITLASVPETSVLIEPRKLNFVFEYKQVALSREQRNKLLYLYDWQSGAIITYGKAKAENDYSGLSIGHQRAQAVIKALSKNQEIIQIKYDPTLIADSVVIEEKVIQDTHITTSKSAGLLESTRL